MPYCSTALEAKQDDKVIDLISLIAVEHFRARDAYPLESDGRWNIDGGENDVRAIQSEDSNIIKFFCRYKVDVRNTEAKIINFAKNHFDACEVISTN